MIPKTDLKKIAGGRLKDADVLLRAGRYDSAIYLCGYALEIGLKARICRTLKWAGFPSTRKEFEGYQSFRTHDLETLLHLSGIEDKIRAGFAAEWGIVSTWDPEMRYRLMGSGSLQKATNMIESTKTILGAL